MSEQDLPRKGDRVRWSLAPVEGVVEEVWSATIDVRDGNGDVRVLSTAAQHKPFVEVLERADEPPKYRVGNKNPRNIYLVADGHEVHVGVMFDPADGPYVVEALNAARTRASDAQTPDAPWGQYGQQPAEQTTGGVLVGRTVVARRKDGTVYTTGKATAWDGNAKYVIECGEMVIQWPEQFVEPAEIEVV